MQLSITVSCSSDVNTQSWIYQFWGGLDALDKIYSYIGISCLESLFLIEIFNLVKTDIR